MKKTELPKLDLFVYEEHLENGLSIYVVPRKNAKGTYVTFTTRYGGGIDEFVPLGETEYHKFPHGIAHFLEHKMFEQEDGIDPMNFFSEHGANSNANTNPFKTTYLFSGSGYLEENLNYLLDFVQSPYFTDENVEKEKGIIVQEAKMYLDQPGAVLYDESMLQLLVNDTNRYSTIGSIEEINSITKEQLYQCYQTFYHPSNMFLVITGNVDAEEVVKIVSENQNKKVFSKAVPIRIQDQVEPYELSNPRVEKYSNIVIPKVSYNIKVDIQNLLKYYDQETIGTYCDFLLENHFSLISLLDERLRNVGIITEEIGGMLKIVGHYLLATFVAETKKVEEFIGAVEQELQDLKITKEEFERSKKTSISSILKSSDSIYAINHKLVIELSKYHKFYPDDIQFIKDLTYADLEVVRNCIQTYKSGVVILYPQNLKKEAK